MSDFGYKVLEYCLLAGLLLAVLACIIIPLEENDNSAPKVSEKPEGEK